MMDSIPMDEDNDEKVEKSLDVVTTEKTVNGENTENSVSDVNMAKTVTENTENPVSDAKTEKPASDTNTEKLINDEMTENPNNDVSTENPVNARRKENTVIDEETEKTVNHVLTEKLVSNVNIEKTVSDVNTEQIVIDVEMDETGNDVLTKKPVNGERAEKIVIDEETGKTVIDVLTEKPVNVENTEKIVNDVQMEKSGNDVLTNGERTEEIVNGEDTDTNVNDVLTENPVSVVETEKIVSDENTEEQGSDVNTEKIVKDDNSEEPVSDVETIVINVKTEKIVIHVKTENDKNTENPVNDVSNLLTEKASNDENTQQPVNNVKTEKPVNGVKNEIGYNVEIEIAVNDENAEKPVNTDNTENPVSGMKTEQTVIDIKTEKVVNDVEMELPVKDVLTEKPISDVKTEKTVIDIKSEEIVKDIEMEIPDNDEKAQTPVNTDNTVSDTNTEKAVAIQIEQIGNDVEMEIPVNDLLTEHPVSDVKTEKAVIDIKTEGEIVNDIEMEIPVHVENAEKLFNDVKIENVEMEKSVDGVSDVLTEKTLKDEKTEIPVNDGNTDSSIIAVKSEKIGNSDKSENDVNDEKKKKNFDRRLISQIRKFRIIYDSRHKFFSNAVKIDSAWQEIADKLKSDADTCKSRYTELCHKYQSYVSRLRNHFISNQKENCEQFCMNLDSELICLFKFIYNPKYCPLPHDIVVQTDKEREEGVHDDPASVDDDVILIEQKPELIVIDEDDGNTNAEEECKVTKEMKRLVEQVRKYRELYDITRADYSDYTRKSYVWNSIAVEVGDKGTKLMKRWILMVTRYEWEISRKLNKKKTVAKKQTELQKLLAYFEPYILANPHTVYKHSFYLKQSWHNPIEYFKEIHTLIERMKKIPQVVYVTDVLLNKPKKNKQFLNMWDEVAKMKGSTPGQCETTWLIMRLFYSELMKMREHNYQLTDKWYFETVVTELYELAKESQKKQQRRKYVDKLENAKRRKVECAKQAGSNNGDLPITTTVSTNLPSAIGPYITHPQSQLDQPPLLKITSAISLAPKIVPTAAVNGSLIIRPIGLPSNMLIPPTQQPLSNSIPPLQLPFALPKQTKVSAIIMSPAAAAATAVKRPASPSIMISDARTVMYPAPNSRNRNIIVTPKPANTSNDALMPMVYINAGTNVSTIIPFNMGSTIRTPAPATATRVSSAAMPPLAPLPKIGGAISLFNSNEIITEFVESTKGKCLFVEHPPLREKYNLPMPTVEKFIREVLAIPLLHQKQHTQPNLINGYWEHISQKFRLPPHICRACWNFLEDKFSQIAPLKELMKPFSTTLIDWTESFDLFQRFDQHAVSNGWLDYISSLPELIKCIGSYPVLYKDVAKDANEPTSDKQELRVLRTIGSRFPNINHISTIWTSFKNVFCQYMSDIELGIDNKWHIHWWRVLARMKFLVEARYKANEPYYYIVSNKMMKEIKRCALIES